MFLQSNLIMDGISNELLAETQFNWIQVHSSQTWEGYSVCCLNAWICQLPCFQHCNYWVDYEYDNLEQVSVDKRKNYVCVQCFCLHQVNTLMTVVAFMLNLIWHYALMALY